MNTYEYDKKDRAINSKGQMFAEGSEGEFLYWINAFGRRISDPMVSPDLPDDFEPEVESADEPKAKGWNGWVIAGIAFLILIVLALVAGAAFFAANLGVSSANEESATPPQVVFQLEPAQVEALHDQLVTRQQTTGSGFVSFDDYVTSLQPGYNVALIENTYLFIAYKKGDQVKWYEGIPASNWTAEGVRYADGYTLGNALTEEYVRSMWTQVTVIQVNSITEVNPISVEK